jgi:hypothetical protein
MKSFLIAIILLGSSSLYAQQSYVHKFESKSGKMINVSFKARYASIRVDNEELVQEGFGELKEFMRLISKSHLFSRIYPLYVISPENKYFTYPLNRQKLIKWKN